MPDIFISYKKEERQIAADLAARLTGSGYDVWWDAALLAGDRFEDEIASVLRTSRAVIVLWSKRAVASDWVKAEAESARGQKKALPAIIDDLPMDELPLLFRGIHIVRLTGWAGEPDHPGYAELMAAVNERLGAAAGPALSLPQAEAKLAESVSEAEVWSAIAGSADPSAAEYRAYLKRFGPKARFAEIAEIRIIRLEAQEKQDAEDKQERKRTRRNWAPALVLPLLALLLIAALGAWFWWRGDLAFVTDMLIPAEAKAAAARCTDWSKSGDTEWQTTLPRLTGTIAADCELAVKSFPSDGDHRGRLAAIRLVQGSQHNGEALDLVHQGIELGSAVSEDIFGVMYLYGLGLLENATTAATHFQKAAATGNADAAARLCALAEDHNGYLPYSATASEVFAICTTAADAGSPLGLAMLGYIYENGDLTLSRPDPTKAAEYYERALEANSPAGKLLLGAMLWRGIAVTRNAERAVQLFEAAKNAGYPEAMRWLGIARETGIGAPRDYAIAGQLYEQANERGDTVSQLLIGLGLPNDPERGDFTLREIGRLTTPLNTPIALRISGLTASLGFYQTRNVELAKQRFEQCAAANPFCALALGGFHKYGPQQYDDIARARELFEAAAASGELHAQFELAVLYEQGDGVAQDTNEALRLYELASAQGSLLAGDRIAALTQTGTTAPSP
ncbi:MAG: toll/interleukin-1 receptor domain-containing protein [Devosia sp.]